MAKLINRTTGKSYTATKEQVQQVRENELTRSLYDIIETEEPAEVKELKEVKEVKEGKGDKNTRTKT